LVDLGVLVVGAVVRVGQRGLWVVVDVHRLVVVVDFGDRLGVVRVDVGVGIVGVT
jgi:hypothetical protein